MKPVLEEVSSKDVRDHMASILNHVAFGGKRYMLTRHGYGVAVMISVKEWEVLESILQKLEDEEDVRDADNALKRIRKGEPTLSHEEVKRMFDL